MGKRGPACTICEHSKRAEIEALSNEESARVVASLVRPDRNRDRGCSPLSRPQ
jgi:hypothetical protein